MHVASDELLNRHPKSWEEEDPDMPGNEAEEARKWAEKRRKAAAAARPQPLDEDD